jgi:hypothetical protein
MALRVPLHSPRKVGLGNRLCPPRERLPRQRRYPDVSDGCLMQANQQLDLLMAGMQRPVHPLYLPWAIQIKDAYPNRMLIHH